MDKCTLSNYGDVVVTHIEFEDLNVDFSTKTIAGTVTHTCLVKTAGADHVAFDTKALELDTVHIRVGDGDTERAAFHVDSEVEPFGHRLRVPLPAGLAEGTEVFVTIAYNTSCDSTAVQWLEPEQTADKEHPYLFTQCQAIHARTLFPCQDCPGVKATYNAKLTVPKGLTGLMSALREGSEEGEATTTFSFRQPVPMPAYLVAIAVGRLEGREVGPRTTVWAEPSVVESVAYEFGETETYLATAERLFGEYVWGRYDILCMPPSFPYGGMENCCLTYVTPTLLAGDRSLADVVVHEISHSWTGNLVTNATWEHFWLNESFTMMLQRKIVAELRGGGEAGQRFFEFDAQGGVRHLKDDINLFMKVGEPEYTRLVPDLTGVDPDDVFSSVPYEFGFNLLVTIQRLVGGPDAFNPFLRAYIERFAYKTLTTDDFKAFVYEFFAEHKDGLDQIAWDEWFYGEGLGPVGDVTYDDTIRSGIRAVAQAWVEGDPSDMTATSHGVSEWGASEHIGFLDVLSDYAEEFGKRTPAAVIHPDVLRCLGRVYGYASSGNAEIRFRFLKLCLASGCEEAVAGAVDMLKTQGRMKFVRPLFRALNAVVFGQEAAKATFESHGNSYHPIAFKMVDMDFTKAETDEATDPSTLATVKPAGALPDAATEEGEEAAVAADGAEEEEDDWEAVMGAPAGTKMEEEEEEEEDAGAGGSTTDGTEQAEGTNAGGEGEEEEEEEEEEKPKPPRPTGPVLTAQDIDTIVQSSDKAEVASVKSMGSVKDDGEEFDVEETDGLGVDDDVSTLTLVGMGVGAAAALGLVAFAVHRLVQRASRY
jgi:leukotriene-A4 hydrolase